MGKVVMGTDMCLEAPDHEDDGCFILGDYSSLSELPGVNENEIEFSHSAWDDEKEYFASFLKTIVEAYERRYRTSIHHIALAGHVGLWNGSPVGGRFLSVTDNPLDFMGNVDEVDVYIHDDGEVTLRGHHHDGTHRMGIYLLPDSVYERIEHNDYEAFEWIYENRKPINAKQAPDYFTNYQTEKAS